MAVIVLLLVSVIIFTLMQFLPGDPIVARLGIRFTPENYAELSRRAGLDQPLPVQYFVWMSRMAQGDMGRSIISHIPVAEEIGRRLPATMLLTAAAMVISVCISIPTGIAAATTKNRIFRSITLLFGQVGVSLPQFWVGIMLILGFSLYFRWFPSMGYEDIWIDPAKSLHHMVLPAISLGLGFTAMISRFTRSAMLEVMNLDYVRTARSKGLKERKVILKHAFRNALLPVVTIIGLDFGYLFGGAIVVEQVFAWPGMGRLILQGVMNRDYPVVMGGVLVFAAIFMFVNLVTDLIYTYVDPRIRY